MPYKAREESKELMMLRSLNTRMELAADDKKHYLNLKKGYEGEVKFDKLTASLDRKFYILNHLLLKNGSTSFQIDSLIITQNGLIPCEVKNFDGDYYYENGDFYVCSTKNKINNPLHQLNRCETQLHQLLQKQGFQLPIFGYVVFINPEFTLYQSPFNNKIIYPTQLNHFLRELSAKPSKLNGNHLQIAEFLFNSHITDSPFTQTPSYSYDQVKKGPTCASCHSFSITVGEKKMVCNVCGFEEKIEAAVVRNVDEIKLLFPDLKITTNLVYEWCEGVGSKKVIRGILKKNYKTVGYGKWFFYE